MKGILSTSFVLTFLLGSIAYALPTLSSVGNQTFTQNESATQLSDLTITEDLASTYITKGSIKITIPAEIQMIFDSKRTQEELLIYGSAVDSGKVAARPQLTFEDKDKTLVVPVLADFAPGEQVIITKSFVEGFHSASSSSKNLTLKVGTDSTEYIDTYYVYIVTSTLSDTHLPDMPGNIVVADEAQGGVKITWTDPTDLDLQTIQVLRGKNAMPVSGTPLTEVAKGTQSYIDTDVVAGDTVKYILRANDGRNLSANSSEISFTVGTGTTAPPGEPETPVVDEPADTPEEQVCTMEYAPVCGVDGVTYSNTCFAEAAKIEVDYEGECKPEIEFTDISGHWAKDYITALYEKGVVSGKDAQHFAPDDNVSRAEFIKMALLGLDLTLLTKETIEATVIPNFGKTFSDVPDIAWFYQYVYSLVAWDVLSGYDDDTFRPNLPVTRAEALKILFILANSKVDAAAESDFQDVEQTSWYAKYVNFASEKGIVSGFGDNTFRPNDFITRGQAAKVIEETLAKGLPSEFVPSQVTPQI